MNLALWPARFIDRNLDCWWVRVKWWDDEKLNMMNSRQPFLDDCFFEEKGAGGGAERRGGCDTALHWWRETSGDFFFFFFWHAVRINPRREQQMVLELRRSSKDVNSAAEDAAASLRLTERHWGCSDGTSWALSSVDRIKDWRLSANYHELPRWGWQVGRAQRA